MPADYASIIRVGLADLEFLRHERKGLSRPACLQAKTARFGAPISIKRARKDLVRATMADLETQIQKLSVAIAGLESQRKSLGDAVVDPAIAALREQLNQLESARGDRAETDERKLVTIVFADVSGFTALSEKLDPEKVREIINACFDWLVPVVQKYDGTIDKFIGDEIMAVFVAPATYRQTQRLFDFEPVAPLKLKGKEAPVEVRRLLRAKAVPKPMRGIEGLRAPLIGRDG